MDLQLSITVLWTPPSGIFIRTLSLKFETALGNRVALRARSAPPFRSFHQRSRAVPGDWACSPASLRRHERRSITESRRRGAARRYQHAGAALAPARPGCARAGHHFGVGRRERAEAHRGRQGIGGEGRPRQAEPPRPDHLRADLRTHLARSRTPRVCCAAVIDIATRAAIAAAGAASADCSTSATRSARRAASLRPGRPPCDLLAELVARQRESPRALGSSRRLSLARPAASRSTG